MKWKELLQFNTAEIFTIDLRSLALVRIGAGALLFLDIISRLPDVRVFYGDGGVFPSALLHTLWTGEWAWSLHLIAGGPSYLVYALFILQGIAALSLLVGYRTRLATILSWLLLVSLHNANPFILQGGDFWLRATLFVGMFLPWSAAFSFDARTKTPESFRLFSGWSVAYLLQVGLFYFFAALYKSGAEWVSEGSAVYYALSIDQYATPLAHFLLRFPEFLTGMTFTIVIVQHVMLFLLFSPFFTKYLRTLGVVTIIFWHVALEAGLHLGIFSWISIVAALGLLPSWAWDSVLPRMRIRVPRGSNRVTTQHVLMSLVGVAYLLYIFVWQMSPFVGLQRYLPAVWEVPAKVLRIDQRWNLFAPYPFKTDGWYVIPGTLVSGERVDLFQKGAPVSFEKPESVYRHYPSMRWRKYTYETRLQANAWLRAYHAAYLCRSWNVTHTGNEQLESLEIVYMRETTPPLGTPTPAATPVTLFAGPCDDLSSIRP